MYRYILLNLFFFFFVLSVTAQTWEIGGFAGSSAYMGDINPIKPYKVRNLSLGGLVKYNFDPYWSLKLGFMHGNIEASDAESSSRYQQNRNLSFFSSINELSLQTEFNFFNYVPSISKKKYSPYLFTGIGVVLFNPKTTLFEGTDFEKVYTLRDWGTEGQDLNDPYRNYALSVPLGIGLKYNFTGKWSLISEVGYRTAFTDYLDDVSGAYPDFSSYPKGEIRRILSDKSIYGNGRGDYLFTLGTQRGDFRPRDTYMFVGFSLTYTFISQKCPLF